MSTPDPTTSDIDELTAYLSALSAPGFEPISEWGGGRKKDDGAFVMPWPKYHITVEEFFRAAGKECWCDYEYDSAAIEEVIQDSANFAKASLSEIKSMLTWCVRGERFGAGHWAMVIEKGYVRNILLRLQSLRTA